jgi:hypothetical protein
LRGGAVAAALAALLAASSPRAQEMPRIFLEKKIFSETTEGKKSFYEVHTVSKGDTLWKILGRRSPLFPSDWGALLREFRRANPDLPDPDKLRPGQRILVPSGEAARTRGLIDSGRTVAHRVARGEALLRILSARGVSRDEAPRYLEAVRELNPSVRDVDRILAGDTLLLPTAGYFEEAVAVAEAPAAPPGPMAAAAAPRREEGDAAEEISLTKDVPPEGEAALAAARPEAQLAPPSPASPEASAILSSPGLRAPGEPASVPAPAPAYRGLLSDVVAGLGETWVDRGTLYLPLPSGGEVVLALEDYPVARFSTGAQALVDLRGALPSDVRAVITEAWKNYRVVSLGGSSGPLEAVERLLRASGYYSVKEGLSRPLVIGEEVAVDIPADWVVLKTEQSLLGGEVVLVKEVPEKPEAGLSAVLRYAARVGVRVLPFAADRSAGEGFLVGLEAGGVEGSREFPGKAVPERGLEAVDAALDVAGLRKMEGEKVVIGGRGGAFRLTIVPERIFEAGGKKYVVDTGRMSPAIRSIVRDSGYEVFDAGREESGRSILRRVLSAAGIAFEDRKAFLLAGGEQEGFAVRVTGTFLSAPDGLREGEMREAVLVRGKVHAATRDLMAEFGVEIMEW